MFRVESHLENHSCTSSAEIPRTFNSKYIEPQRARFHRWVQALAGRRVALLEIGCGCSEHSLRMRRRDDRSWISMSGEWKIPRLVCPLVRIDPGEDGKGGMMANGRFVDA